MVEDDSGRIERLLQQNNRLTALSLVKGMPLTDQVSLLNLAGMSPSEIGTILGKTSHHVSVVLHEVRKHGKRGPTKAKNSAKTVEGD